MEPEAVRPVTRHHSRDKCFGQRVDASAIAAAVFTLGVVNAYVYDIIANPYLTGDWGGLRTRLAEQGVNLDSGYGSEVTHNFGGDTERLTRYIDQWIIDTALDLQKLVGWQGVTFQAIVTNRNGHSLGNDVNIGNNMLIQEVYGRGQIWHLTQFWLNQKLLSNRLETKTGRVAVDEDFLSFSCDLQNLTFCGSQPGNLVSGY